ncbi:MAG TPA: hypothetical protein PL070_17285 [Flavobacteriales bacterium]|nr:hypothetical protein [Flavobacteriales bacterium]
MFRSATLALVLLGMYAPLHAQAPAYAWARFAGNVGAQQASGRAIAVDRVGNVFVAGVGAPSITWGTIALTNSQQYLMKADNDGTVLWAKKIPMRPDFLVTDSEGNVYLSSGTQGPVDLDGTLIPGTFESSSILLVKFDPQGTVLWYRNHTPNSDYTSPGRLMVDAADNVYLIGGFNTSITIEGTTYTGDPANGGAVFAVSYAPDGTFRRSNATSSFPPTASYNIAPVAACDTTCAIIRGGPFGGLDQIQVGDFTLHVTSEQTPAYNAYLIKWSANGEVEWALASGGVGTEDITDVVVDGRGHIVVSGGFTGSFFDADSASVFGRSLFLQSQSYNLQDMFVASFMPDGSLDWIKRNGGNHIDAGASLSVDPMDNVYTYGSGRSGLMTFDDITVYPYSGSYLVKYTRSGEAKWAKLMAAGQGDGNNCFGAAGDQWGNVYVTGMQSDTIRLDAFENITPAQNNFDVFVAKLNDCSTASFDLLADGPLAFCPGDSVELQGPATDEHQWNTGEYTPAITVDAEGSYHLITADEAGCLAYSDTLTTTIHTPLVPTITLNAGILSSTAAVSYQWNFEDGPVDGATSIQYDPDVQGNYSVITTDANGCSAVSDPIFFSTVGIEERSVIGDRVINQGEGLITIVLRSRVDELAIVNALGQQVWHVERPGNLALEARIPATGLYFLGSTRGAHTTVQRFMAVR